MKTNTKNYRKLLLTFCLLFVAVIGFSQVTIQRQGFDGLAADNLSYSVSSGTYVSTSSTMSVSGTKSLRFTGSGSNSNTDTDAIFSNVDISAYKNVSVSIDFAATGVDNNEDLYIDFSYDNGANYTDSVELVDGNNGGSGQNLAYGAGDSSPGQSTNPYIFSVPTTATSVLIRVRSLNLDSGEYYYIDNVVVSGTLKTPQEINVQGNSNNIASGSTAIAVSNNTDFGITNVLGGTVTKTYTIQNTGDINLSIWSVSSNSSDFTVSTSSSTIVPGGTATLTVVFDPTTGGTRNGTISISNNDSDESTYTFAVQGIGNGQEINVTGNGNTILTGSTAISTTNNTDFGTDSGTRTFIIENLGGDTLNISSVYDNSGDFSVTSSSYSIAPGGTATLTVTFVKSAPGTSTATIGIANNDSDESTYTFNVRAIVPDKEINLQGNTIDILTGSATISVANNTDFGSVDITTGTVSKTFTIQNTGGFNLSIWSVYTNSGEFTVSTSSATIVPGGTATLTVVFDPNTVGTRNGIVSISNNDADESTYTFAVSGIGTNIVPSNKTVAAVATSVCSGTSTNITVANSLATETYQLRNNTGNTLIGIAVTGNGGTINLPTGNLSSATTFNVLAKITASGTTAQMTNTPTVTVNSLPINKTIAASTGSVCSGSSTNITVASSLNTTTYQLRNSIGNVLIGSAVTGNGGTLSLPTGNLSSNTTFNVLATISATGCILQMTTTPTVTINALPADKTVAASSSSVCSGSSTNITLASSLNTTTYQLRNSIGNVLIGSAVTGTGGTISLPTGNLSSNTTFNVLATITTTGCTAQMTLTPTVTVNPLPTNKTVSGTTLICSGTATNISVSNTLATETYQLRNNSGNINIGAAITGTGGTINVSTGNLSSNTTFNVLATNIATGCSAQMTTTPSVTIDASPINKTVAAASSSICNGKSTNITVASSSNTTSYQLRDNSDNSLIGTAIIGTGGTINLPTGNLNSTTTFNVLATLISNGCTLQMTTKPTVTINACDPEINVIGNGVSIADGDTMPSAIKNTYFNSISIMSETYTATYTITNTGVGDLLIGAITFTGLDAADFAVLNPPAAIVAPGGTTTVDIIFDPTTIGIKKATVNIASNDADESNYNFDVMGKGIFIDTDGDGVPNNIDIDDDNDGILDSTENGFCISDPFINGSFETTTPLLPATSYIITPEANVPGWQSSPEGQIEIWSTGFNGTPAAVGNQFAELNANVPGTLYQSFCLNGASGTIKWSIKHRGRSGVDQAFVKFGKTLTDAQASSPIVTMVDDNNAWGTYSGVYTIPYGQKQIFLTFQSGYTASGSPSIGNFIDDVQITIIQNSVDTDQDGIVNIEDLDDDNDGIPDIEEAGFKKYSNNSSTMDMTNPTNWKDTNGNGMNDYIDALIAANNYHVIDTDGDGLPDYIDLDSDNDSLFDVDEAGLYNGDGDINGDGKGDGLDSDGDGILDLYDNASFFGTNFRPYTLDTDANGIADYRQLDSNSDGIKDIKTGLYGSFDANNDGKIDGSGDADYDGITDTFDTDINNWGSPRDLNRKLYLDFDGRNDYAQGTGVLGGLASGTLMAWIDLNSSFSGDGVVLGQTNFQIRVTSSKKLEVSVNGSTLAHTAIISTAQWTHVGAVYGNGLLKLYINGQVVNSIPLAGTIHTDTSLLTIGKDPTTNTKFFKGKIDEVRIFNIALSDEQYQRMVYQEIQDNSSQVRGAIIPRDIGALPFANVLRYYRMDVYKDDIIDDLSTPTIDTGSGMRIYNHKNIYYQEAPLPFVTSQVGDFASAVNNPSRDIRGLDVIDYDYSIIQVKHNITENSNASDIGLLVDPGVTISMINDTKMLNDWYLKLDGKIDLVGKSQLVQTKFSELDATSAGSIERDQQGQSNMYNYNYWSSPVGAINTTTNNNTFTVASVMKDGTDPANIQDIQWTSSQNVTLTSPITISSAWIYKFQNLSPIYANWGLVGQNGTLLAGQGFLMKGSAAATPTQNYTFVGKPNNGKITIPIAANNLNLCGNPYPSALDATAFIMDNAASTTGTLYFWEHFSTNNTHVTRDYQGGYSARNLVGGTPPVSPAGISGLGSSTRIPERFVPVGQGFLVYGSTTGGDIIFDNNQRGFIKETNVDSNVMFKQKPNSKTEATKNNNQEDVITDFNFEEIRLGFNSTSNYHRQILIGFMNEYATSGIDAGYDALNIDQQPNDMYFINSGLNLIIQGDGYFNSKNIYPLGLKTKSEGNVSFTLDATENFNNEQEIYIYDNVTDLYHDIRNDKFEINLPKGTFDDRFSLRFTKTSSALATTDFKLNENITIAFTANNNMINVKNNLLDTTVTSVMLFNMLGQSINSWNVNDKNQKNIQFPVKNLSTGTYIVKVATSNGNISKKIIIQ